MVTHTSDIRGAGTDASVYVTLTGESGSSPCCSLLGPNNAADPAFERGGTDGFVIKSQELGVLQSLTIGKAVNPYRIFRLQMPCTGLRQSLTASHIKSRQLYDCLCCQKGQCVAVTANITPSPKCLYLRICIAACLVTAFSIETK